ncbi:hypothetical protein PLICRDRAFT_56334 [Plicaturopsis crispa FD-325 SS-3]|nr:hypothetical protein PLICRDRAFT_56334 [Plicaturopsis crispa FD-325 SS-3]
MATVNLPPKPRLPTWKALAPAPPPGTTTFAAQSTLQPLPVPTLEDTIMRLNESLKPLARNEDELKTAHAKIIAFAQGPAEDLQRRLLERAASTPHWLEEWWDDTGYLGYRESVVVNVSYYYGFSAHPAHLPQTPVARAAAIARAGMLFRRQLKRGELAPEATKEGPLCVDTYRWMFDCARVPGAQGLDWYVSYAEEGDTGDAGHIVVFRNNRPWKIDMFDGTRLLSVAELEKQIQVIYDHSTGEYPGVGVLTASNRDVWAKDYVELTSRAENAAIVADIHSAAFTISLDASSPTTPVDHSRQLWHGAPGALQNRWVDKPCQFIVFDNAVAGFMGEHAVMDGTPTVRLCDSVLDLIHSPDFASSTSGSNSSSKAPTPLDWKVSPTVTDAIKAANAAAEALTGTQVLGIHNTKYGKAAIKNFGVSPDSWAQMIVQLAYARLLRARGEQRQGGTYEAATTRRFFKGRTEAIRVVTSEADAWVSSMDDPSASAEKRKELFNKATKKHVQLAKSGGAGMGVDRHLFGLKKVLGKKEEVPTIFSDPLIQRSSNWVLSTSAVFSKHFEVYGWGEVVPEGFGVAYMTGFDDHLQYTVTSRKEMPHAQFVKEIEQAAVDLYDLHAALASHAKAKL